MRYPPCRKGCLGASGGSLRRRGKRISPLVTPWTLLLHVYDKTEPPQIIGQPRGAFVRADIDTYFTLNRLLNFHP